MMSTSRKTSSWTITVETPQTQISISEVEEFSDRARGAASPTRTPPRETAAAAFPSRISATSLWGVRTM